MENGEIILFYNEETNQWEKREEPFAVIECSTEEDYNRLKEMIQFWKEHNKDEE